MNILRFILFVTILVLPIQTMADPSVQIDTTPKKEASYYPWITYMSRGPINWLGEDSAFEVQGRSYRVVVITAEIYNRVYIEEITSGDEGCCVKVASIRELNLEQLYRHFGFKGEISGFKVIEWQSKTSFEFSIHDKHFLLTDADKEKVTVKKL